MKYRQERTAGIILLAAAVLFMAGCRDGTSPELRGATVKIYSGSVPVDEQTIGVGEVLQLTGSVLDTGGKPVSGQTVEWSSTNPDVASVDASGTVQAKAVGSTDIIARHQVGADTVRINVAEFVTGPVECSAEQELSIAPGEVRVFAGEEAVRLCLPGGTAPGADYTLVTFNQGSTAASTLPVEIRSAGVRTPFGPSPALLTEPRPVTIRPDQRFHDRLRTDVSRRLEPRLAAGLAPGAITAPTHQLALNQTVSYNVETASSDGCSNPVMRGGRVRAISNRAIIVADTLNPAGGYSTQDYERFAAQFDEDVWPLVTSNFGEPSDIDGNGRVVIFFTSAVNQLAGNAGSGSYIGGFFFNRDLFPKTGSGACAGSNATEMFYMLVPDPAGTVGPARSYDFVNRSTATVLVHEFQHLVNDSRRLHLTKAPVWEDTWLNEGLSHIAEELMFYRRSGLRPGSNIAADDLSTPARRDAFRIYQLDNIDRLTSFLQVPATTSAMGPDLLATRGASWAFLRYAADRRGGVDQTGFWLALVKDARLAGVDNLRAATNADPLAWMTDWAIALYVDDTSLGAEGRYRIPSWDFRRLYPGLGSAGVGTINRPYPLSVTQLFAQEPRVYQLQGGSAGYSRFGVNAGQRAAIRVTVGSTTAGQRLPPPNRLKVAVVRTR